MARVERALPLRRPLRDEVLDVADRPQGDDFGDDRGAGRGADDVAARGHRRQPELGLPVLLAARLGAGAGGAARAGYTEEALAFREFLLRVGTGDPANAQIMYGVGGERRLTEFELPHLPGYEGSQPVRVGNAASEQFQLDVYGEVAGVMFIGAEVLGRIDNRLWPRWRAVVEHVETIWRRARRRDLGGARTAAPLHVLQGHGVGGLRPSGPHRGTTRPRRTPRALEADPGRDPRRGVRARLRPGAANVHPVLRIEGA